MWKGEGEECCGGRMDGWFVVLGRRGIMRGVGHLSLRDKELR